MAVGIDAEMQFAPAPRGTNTTLLIQPLALAVDLQTSAVDEEMQRFVATTLVERSTRPLGGSMSCGRELQFGVDPTLTLVANSLPARRRSAMGGLVRGGTNSTASERKIDSWLRSLEQEGIV